MLDRLFYKSLWADSILPPILASERARLLLLSREICGSAHARCKIDQTAETPLAKPLSVRQKTSKETGMRSSAHDLDIAVSTHGRCRQACRTI